MVPYAIIGILSGLGLLLGIGLAYASLKFGIKVDPRIHEVEDILPKGQCGACGFAGCAAYAEAVVTKPEVTPDLCLPGKAKIALEVAKITGKEAGTQIERKAFILCAGSKDKAKKAYSYDGIQDCRAVNILFRGDKLCKYGCLGLGSCTQVCPFGAISIAMDTTLPEIDYAKCTGCGRCVSACPKGQIVLVDEMPKVWVFCNSLSKGKEVKDVCTAGCISCMICIKECPFNAINMENNLPKINHSICKDCHDLLCLSKCPTSAIKSL